MANLSRTHRNFLNAIFQVTRPQRRTNGNALASQYQQRCQYSEAPFLNSHGNGFSVSFPLEFDDAADDASPRPRVANRTRTPKSKAGPKAQIPIQQRITYARKRDEGKGAKRRSGEDSRTAKESLELLERNPQSDDIPGHSSYSPVDQDFISMTADPEETEAPPGKRILVTRTGQENESLQRPLSSKKEDWQVQKQALKEKFGETGWSPRKKLSPDTIEGIRALHEQYPDKYTTPVLAEEFKVSPEAIRRILRSKWRPDPETMEERRERWARRHDRIWDQKAALGLRPQRTKEKEAESPEAFEEALRARQILGNR